MNNLEFLIGRRGSAVLRCQAIADECTDLTRRAQWREEARIAARDVALLIQMRETETVQRMERERGLA